MRTNLLIITLLLITNLFIKNNCHAQQDTTQNTKNVRKLTPEQKRAKKKARHEKFLSTLPKNHNPKTATLLALIPGMGQIYNRRYWKLPIVWGGLGVLGYFTATNYIEYGCYRKAYLHAVDEDPTTNYQCTLDTLTNPANLKIVRDAARTNSETFLLLSILVYGLTITDAFVDAHLMRFDIDDDLSMTVQPQMGYNFNTKSVVPSLSLTVQFRPKTTLVYPVQF